jgi:hypothetical protein
MAVDAFLKFDGLGGEGQKLGNDFDRLGGGFSDLGGAFIKIVSDVTSAGAADQIQHDISTIGDDFSKIGQDFVKLADPLDTFDNAIVKLAEEFGHVVKTSSFPLATDFLQFESDIKLTGAAFQTVASDIKSNFNTAVLVFPLNEIATDFQNQSDDALKIKQDIANFVDTAGISNSSELGMAFLKYSADWQKISDAYLKLSADFRQISSDFIPAGGKGHGPSLTFDQVVQKFPGDFVQLGQDLKLADAALSGLGGDFHKLADAFENAGPSATPTFKLG